MSATEAWAEKLAVQETINRYSDAANRADWQALESCYAPGSIWEVVQPLTLRFEEPHAIREGIARYIGGVETFVQTVHNTVITLHDEVHASARSTIQEMVRPGAANGNRDLVIWGMTYDELVKIDGQWRFSRRRFHGVYVDTSQINGKPTLGRNDLE